MSNPPFKKILVANRGEIALRIIRAARELGIRSVAVYSQADAESMHVKFADESVCIGPPSPTESYLHIPALIAAAEITGTDAIHPGYGFLSENPRFAETCEKSGFTFIGPTAQLIEQMGDKVAARKAMKEAGLASVPGSTEPLTSDDQAYAVAKEIGFPLIIKASAGGGGRGMKIVREPGELPTLLATARREAGAAFGNDAVYVERFIEKPRHIEFQVVADKHGNVVHLGERECSVQRRYQKLIEEAPSPALTPERRADIGNTVTTALKRLGYTSVGTVEFLMDATGELYFIEMNTRIQVEHPVTEMIAQRDLVRLQIRIAAGEPLPFTQDDVVFSGHAIECRINAENPDNFAPSPGHISALNFPGGAGVRVDTHITHDAFVPPHYDSMLAKVIVHDVDRQQAIRRMQSALRETVVEGIHTNVPFQQRVLDNAEFLEGRYDTGLVGRILDS